MHRASIKNSTCFLSFNHDDNPGSPIYPAATPTHRALPRLWTFAFAVLLAQDAPAPLFSWLADVQLSGESANRHRLGESVLDHQSKLLFPTVISFPDDVLANEDSLGSVTLMFICYLGFVRLPR